MLPQTETTEKKLSIEQQVSIFTEKVFQILSVLHAGVNIVYVYFLPPTRIKLCK